MSKNTWLVLLALILFLFSATKKTGLKLSGSYSWHYTMVENEVMLIKQVSSTATMGNVVRFNSNSTFIDSRRPSCGNDISYQKKGKYTFSKTKLILHYTGGKFADNVGGNTRQVYVLGKVFYNVRRINMDTIFLIKVKGNSEKKVHLTEIKQ